jgi:hypothetical protein
MEPLNSSERVTPNGLDYLDNPGPDSLFQLTDGQFLPSTNGARRREFCPSTNGARRREFLPSTNGARRREFRPSTNGARRRARLTSWPCRSLCFKFIYFPWLPKSLCWNMLSTSHYLMFPTRQSLTFPNSPLMLGQGECPRSPNS